MRRLGGFAALVAAGALALTACGQAGANPAAGGVVTVNGTEPQNPLIPTDTNEVGGGKILDLVFAGLVHYDAEGVPHHEVAESIESDDAQNYTITIRDGWTFTNGEPVTAHSFVDAWNYGALLSNEQLSSYFFEDIEGFSYEEDSPLTGLTVVDDLTFTVALTSPKADFPLRLGYSAYFPLPQAAFEDMESFGENPIGNGPYRLAEDGWDHDVRAELVPNEDYSGDRAAQNAGVTVVFYTTQDASYNDLLAGQLDVTDQIPDSAFGTFEDDLGDRAVNQPSAVAQSITIPQGLPHFSGEEGALRRQAISMAIDRQGITGTIFQGTRTPAEDFTSPVIAGWSPDLAGSEVLDFDPEAAKELWAQADAIAPWDGTFTIGYNTDGGHQAWVDAATNGLRNVLGIQAEGRPYATFADLLTQISDRTVAGAFRTSWQADYPGLYNFLGPVYGTDGGSNDGDYSDPEFDRLLEEGSSAASAEDADATFQRAQEILFRDLPAIPLWYANITGGSAPTVDDVQFGWNGVPLLYEITKD